MSTTFVTKDPLSFDDLRHNLPEPLYIDPNPDNNDDRFCITDGRDFLWAFRDDDGSVFFERFGGNNVGNIIEIIEDYFDVMFFV